MDEITEWFEQEFGHLGFEVTCLMYDPFTFVPSKGVLYNNRLTNIRITPDLITDLHATGYDVETTYKELLTECVERVLNEERKAKDFIPKKKIIKHKL